MSTVTRSYRDSECGCFQSKDKSRVGAKSPVRLDDNELDKLIVQGMNSLSFNELQTKQEELHGVSADKLEKAADVENMLIDVEKYLQQIKTGTPYEVAEKMNQDYVRNRDFQTQFLRANEYDTKATAEQLIRHFEMKATLFSKDTLARDIVLSDLNDDDIACLLRGSFQVTAFKDRSNRKIMVQLPGLREYTTIENEMRSIFYQYMHILNSLDYTSRGCIFIYYAVGEFREKKNGQDILKYVAVGQAVPLYVAGFHLCYLSPSSALLSKAGIAVLPAKDKARMKVHVGSHWECLYRLSTYGISQHALPISFSTEEVLLEHQLAWYNDCLRKENFSNGSTQSLPTPNENDVLCLGRKVNGVGNDRLLAMASQHADWYNTGNSRERRILVDLIMENIRKKGGRFLKPDENHSHHWLEVSVDEARSKIAQLFRNLKKRARSTANASPTPTRSEPDDSARIVTAVVDEDVLFGRMYEHAGNERLRHTVEGMAAEYNSSTRGRKKQIADSLVQEVKSRGGRFLKPVEGGRWLEVSDKMAETKVSARFRNFRRKTSGDDKTTS
ncbi:unnamed protein product [Cylindrotheca closterium]|uniref:DUF6824 domain-containing protein n=1 Tax=Cylindrotheca closterium TaxID=2856 RepID=A0AAD2CJK9_9STRA|nr:unnamed protein product [Cylindrotheca closterium]